MNDSDVLIGRIGRPHGVKGHSSIQSYTEPEKAIFDYQPWLLGQKKTPMTYADYQVHHKKLIAKLENCDTPEKAKLYTNYDIYIKRSQLKKTEENKMYWHDMVGFEVINENKHLFGKVKQLYDTGKSTIMLIDSENNDTLSIPFIRKKIVLAISEETKTITIKWPTPL